MATCIIQGGEVPTYFCADFLTYERVRSPFCIEDIPDFEVQQSLKKVNDFNN